MMVMMPILDKTKKWLTIFRFNEIYLEQKYKPNDVPNKKPTGEKVDVNWDKVIEMVDNPKAANFPVGSPAREKAEEFNQLYSHFLRGFTFSL